MVAIPLREIFEADQPKAQPTFYLLHFTFNGAKRLCPCIPVITGFIPAPPVPSLKLMKGEGPQGQREVR